MKERNFKRWTLEQSDLAGLTPGRARDLILTCFFEAQKESIQRGKQELGFDTSDDKVKESVQMTLLMAFEETGGSYDAPDRESLIKVVEVLARKAGAWRTPPDIIDHHKGQVMKILEALS